MIRALRLLATYPATYLAITIQDLGQTIDYWGRQLDRACYKLEGLPAPRLMDTGNTPTEQSPQETA